MLSIIIPTLNEEKYLPRLLECITRSNIDDYEIIVSDGQSTDKTIDIAKKYKCRIVTSKKRSPAHQRNQGAKKAQGKLLLFLDADSLLPQNFFQPVLIEFNNRKLDVAGFYVTFNSKKIIYKFLSNWANIFQFFLHKLHPFSVGAGIIVKKKYHKKVNGFDESITIGEDHYYSADIKKINGNYGLIKSKKILFSIRRLEHEGIFTVIAKWHKAAFYALFFGPPRKKIINYEFGKY
jgi:glycosyltransferase involved in cell wall biosynthesis